MTVESDTTEATQHAWNVIFTSEEKEQDKPWLLKLLLGCGMGHTWCWPNEILWPRWISVGQGGVFLPQEVTADSMAMGEIIILKQRGSKSLKTTVSSNRIIQRTYINSSSVRPGCFHFPCYFHDLNEGSPCHEECIHNSFLYHLMCTWDIKK